MCGCVADGVRTLEMVDVDVDVDGSRCRRGTAPNMSEPLSDRLYGLAMSCSLRRASKSKWPS